MKKNILKLVLLTLIVSLNISCNKTKDISPEANTAVWKKYTTDNGLVNDNIHAITIDSSGNIWIGTDMGISSFDGTKWTNYSSNLQVTSIAIDSHGNKWIGTYGEGVVEYTDTNTIHYQHDQNSSNSIVDNHILSIAIDKHDREWIGTDGMGISMFDGKNWTSYNTQDGLIDNHVHTIAVDEQGDKWFGTDSGVSKYNGIKMINYDSSDNLNGINSLVIDKKGNIWIGGWGGLSEFNGNTWKHYVNGTDWLKLSALILSESIDNKGDIWIGTNGWGISMFDGTNWETYKIANKSEIGPVQAIAIDKNGNKWIGTADGLLKLETSS